LGRGPGEFSIDAFAVRVHSDGTVAVRDGINRRDNLFTADGVFLRAVPFTASFTESAALPQGNRIERAKTLESDVLLHAAPDGLRQYRARLVLRCDCCGRGSRTLIGETGRARARGCSVCPS
jgi:hypothetical protein